MFRGKNTENGIHMRLFNWLLIIVVLTVNVNNIRCDSTMGNSTMEPNSVKQCTLYNVTDMLKIKSSCDNETTYLYIKDSQLQLFPHVFEYFPKLRSVDVSKAGIAHIESTTFNTAIHLTTLDMDGSNISTLQKNIFSYASNLVTIDMGNSSIAIIEPKAFHGLSNLERLDLSNNEIVKLDSEIFHPLSRLDTIRLSNNKIEVINEDTFKHNIQLKWAYFSNNNIILVEPNSFIHSKLISLDLGFNQLHDLDVTTMKYLKTLIVANNKLEILKIPPTVEEIHAENNSISVIYSEEKNQLSKLFLSSNYFTNLRNFTNNFDKLQFLDLSNNHYRNIEFSDLKYLVQLRELKLTGNKLSPIVANDVAKYLPKLVIIELSTKHWPDSYTDQLKTNLKHDHNIELGQDRSIIPDDDDPLYPSKTTSLPNTVTEKPATVTVNPVTPTQTEPNPDNVERRLDEMSRRLNDLENRMAANSAAEKKRFDDKLTEMHNGVDDKIEKSHTAYNAEYAAMMSTFKAYEALVIIMFVTFLIFILYKVVVYSKSMLSRMSYRRTQSHDPIFSEQDL